MWEVKILETNMENNLEETSPTMSSQGQTLKYLIDFGQKVKSYFKEFITLHSIWKDSENKIRQAVAGFQDMAVQE